MSDDEKKPQVAWIASLAAADPQPKTLTLPENMTLKKTALHGPLLSALDNNGRLHCGDKPNEQSTALSFGEARHKPLLDNITQYVTATVGDEARVEDMLADETDRLHLIVKDKYDQKHAITSHWHGGDFKPQSSWNLTDSMVLDYQKGLPQVTPAAQDVVDLGRLGKLALHDGSDSRGVGQHFDQSLSVGQLRSRMSGPQAAAEAQQRGALPRRSAVTIVLVSARSPLPQNLPLAAAAHERHQMRSRPQRLVAGQTSRFSRLSAVKTFSAMSLP